MLVLPSSADGLPTPGQTVPKTTSAAVTPTDGRPKTRVGLCSVINDLLCGYTELLEVQRVTSQPSVPQATVSERPSQETTVLPLCHVPAPAVHRD